MVAIIIIILIRMKEDMVLKIINLYFSVKNNKVIEVISGYDLMQDANLACVILNQNLEI